MEEQEQTKEELIQNYDDCWVELKTIVESLEFDYQKSKRGFKSSGTRFRKGVRLLKEKLKLITKLSLKVSKL